MSCVSEPGAIATGLWSSVSVPGANRGPQAGSPLGVVVATGLFDSEWLIKLNLSGNIPSLSLGVLTLLPGAACRYRERKRPVP